MEPRLSHRSLITDPPQLFIVSSRWKWARGRCRPASGISVNENSGRKIAV
ncbi:MAG: hypothetical protein PF904_01805 [Kiritimatiellae bacterium]|nr:hypothetical protein [Kiritimatiellia bacterium]